MLHKFPYSVQTFRVPHLSEAQYMAVKELYSKGKHKTIRYPIFKLYPIDFLSFWFFLVAGLSFSIRTLLEHYNFSDKIVDSIFFMSGFGAFMCFGFLLITFRFSKFIDILLIWYDSIRIEKSFRKIVLGSKSYLDFAVNLNRLRNKYPKYM